MNQTQEKSLFAEFTAADERAWRAAAEESLDGAPFEKKLVTRTPEGIDLQPIYSAESAPAPVWRDRAPGFAPFVRGIEPLGSRAQPWLICQEPAGATLTEANRSLLDALTRGQNAVFLRVDSTGRAGWPIESLADVRVLLDQVDLSAVPVMISAGGSALPMTALLATYLRETGGRVGALRGGVLADPIGEWVRSGAIPGSCAGACEQLAAAIQWTRESAPALRTVGIDAALWADAGASAVQELGFGLATGVEYLRRLSVLGLSTDDAAGSMVFTWSLGSHFFLEIAKLRAARLLWARAAQAAGGSDDAARLVSHGRVTGWNKTLLDPHNNLLRSTTEAFAAVVGGCQSLEIAPFDAVAGEPSELSRRLARNLHLILAEECQLGRVVDPAGGSHYVETLTRQLAEMAWALFQDIERQGGMAAAIAAGVPQALVAKTAAERIAAVESRRDGVIGSNLHPNLKEAVAPSAPKSTVAPTRRTTPAPLQDLARLSPALVTDAAGVFAALSDAFAAGATVTEVEARIRSIPDGAKVAPLTPRRRAESFERLRRRAEAFLAKTGARPKVFLATMGPRKQHAARAEFSTGFFAAGGFEVVPNKGFETPEAAASAALASGAPVVVLCSTDDTYPALVPPLAGALKAAGANAPFVVLAGMPATPELQQQFKSAGVDEFIHLRANCAKLLAEIQNRLGLPNL